MAQTVIGSFGDIDAARAVVGTLERQGFHAGDINLIGAGNAAALQPAGDRLTGDAQPSGLDAQGEPDGLRGVSDRPEGSVAAGALTGGVVGGAAGLLASLAGIAVPGIGVLLAAGPIVAALSGAGVGAVAGGLIGALRQMGIPEPQARRYADSVHRGGALVAVGTTEARAQLAADVMRQHGATEVDTRSRDSRAMAPVADGQADDARREAAKPAPARPANACGGSVVRHAVGSGSGAHLSDTVSAGTAGSLGAVGGDISPASGMGAGGPSSDPGGGHAR